MNGSNASIRLLPVDAPRALDDLLDHTHGAIAGGGPVDTHVRELMAGLDALRHAAGERWPDVVTACREHALYDLFAADPISARSRARPRGYARDAVMLDYIYRGIPADEQVTPLGRALFEAITAAPSAVAVRNRRDLLTHRIDGCAQRVRAPRVLSLACGHLREASSSAAVRWRQLGLLAAVDQDPDTLDVVADDYAGYAQIEPIHGSVRDLVNGVMKFAGYDLVYAAGLYDSLSTPVATTLTRILFESLAPGGELLLDNVARDYATAGFTEAFMDWHLIGRSEVELANLAATLPNDQIAGFKTHTDRTGCIAYLTIVRA